MLFLFFIYNWLILLNSCSDFTNFYSYGELVLPTRTQTNEADAEIEAQRQITEAKRIKCWT